MLCGCYVMFVCIFFFWLLFFDEILNVCVVVCYCVCCCVCLCG